jgi:hypothetical protein
MQPLSEKLAHPLALIMIRVCKCRFSYLGASYDTIQATQVLPPAITRNLDTESSTRSASWCKYRATHFLFVYCVVY